jgi:hypothetical protein
MEYVYSTLIGTTVTVIGTGKTNTTAIIVQSGHTTSTAMVCDNYSISSYTDWFLPSKDEMDAMYTNLAAYGVGSKIAGVCNGYVIVSMIYN